MADIVGSLFGLSPDLVRAQLAKENEARAQFMAQNAPAGYGNIVYGASKLGQNIGSAVQGLLGIEDPQLQRATKLEKVLQDTQLEVGADVSDPTKLYPAMIKNLKAAGFDREATQASILAQNEIQDWTKTQADITLSTEKAKSEMFKAKKEKKSSLELAEDYLQETETNLANAISSGEGPEAISKLTAVRDRAKTAVEAAGQEKKSTDALISEALQIQANPNASEKDKKWADEILNRAAPFKQGTALQGKVWDPVKQTYVDLPGSKADMEAVKAEKAKIKGLFSAINSSMNVKQVMEDALKLVRPDTVGIYAYGVGPIPGKASIKGTDSYNLLSAVKTIQSNLGFDKLQAIRDASKTGGALGNVSNKEIEFLQGAVRNLDIGQSEDVLRKNLQAIYESYARLQASLEEDLKEAQESQANRPQNKPATTGGNLVDMLEAERKKRNPG